MTYLPTTTNSSNTTEKIQDFEHVIADMDIIDNISGVYNTLHHDPYNDQCLEGDDLYYYPQNIN